MTKKKNQIRERREVFRFSNADILGLNTASVVLLVPPVSLGTALQMSRVQFRSNLVMDYGNIDADADMGLFDDFNGNSVESLDSVRPLVASLLSGGPFPMALGAGVAPVVHVDTSVGDVESGYMGAAPSWPSFANLFANGGIYLFFANGGSGDVNGGDPANFLDVFVDYKIVNIE